MSDDILTFSVQHVDSLRNKTTSALAAKVAAAAIPSDTIEQLHVTPEGDLLHTSSFSIGSDGEVFLHGSIGPFPYEMHLKVKLHDAKVDVTLEVDKPIQVPPFTWTFDLTGIIKDASGNIVGASGVVPSATVSAAGLSFPCVLSCGGTAILGILVKCLPSLVGGMPGFVACVTASAGSGAAGIATCIATKCI
jgi:hypothetical protein